MEHAGDIRSGAAGPLHPEWRELWQALRRVNRLAEWDEDKLRGLLGDAASLPPRGQVTGELLHRYYRRVGSRVGQRRCARDGYVSLFSDEPASAGRWIEQLRSLTTTLSSLRLSWGDRPLGRVVLSSGDTSVPVPPDALLLRANRPGDGDRVFGSIGLVAVTNLLLAAWGDHRRFVPLDGAEPLEAYYLTGVLEALELDEVGMWAAPLEEFGDITGWEPETLRIHEA